MDAARRERLPRTYREQSPTWSALAALAAGAVGAACFLEVFRHGTRAELAPAVQSFGGGVACFAAVMALVESYGGRLVVDAGGVELTRRLRRERLAWSDVHDLALSRPRLADDEGPIGDLTIRTRTARRLRFPGFPRRDEAWLYGAWASALAARPTARSWEEAEEPARLLGALGTPDLGELIVAARRVGHAVAAGAAAPGGPLRCPGLVAQVAAVLVAPPVRGRELRAGAALALGLARRGEARDALVGLLLGAGAPRPRASAAVALAMLDDPRGAAALPSVLGELPAADAARLCRLLAEAGALAARPALDRLARSRRGPVRRAARGASSRLSG